MKKMFRKKPVARMVWRLSASLKKAFSDESSREGRYLPMALDAAVPLWVLQFQSYSEERRREEMDRATADDLCLRLEYVLHKGPKKGDSARAFNDLARCIALASFFPGGIRLFGRHWEWKREKVAI